MAKRALADRRKGSGLGKVKQAAAKQKGKAQWFKLEDGDQYVIRMLDTGEYFKDAFCHRVPMESEDGKSTYHADVPCLDQDDKGIACPGCKDDLDRRYKFWTNVIVRDWEDDANGNKPTDTVMVWSSGITIAKRLDKLDSRHPLDSRDLVVEREGSKMKDTRYEVEWADEEENPLSDNDKKLLEKKIDLTRYFKPPEFDDFYLPAKERGGKDDDDEDVGKKSLSRGSAFKRRKKDEDEDDEDDKPVVRRSTKSKPKPSGLSGFGAGKKSSGSAPAKTTVRRRSSR